MIATKNYIEKLTNDIDSFIKNNITIDGKKANYKQLKELVISSGSFTLKQFLWNMFFKVNNNSNRFYYSNYMYNDLHGNDDNIYTALKAVDKKLDK